MAQAGAEALAVNTQDSCARQGVSMDTDSGCGRAETGRCRGCFAMAQAETGRGSNGAGGGSDGGGNGNGKGTQGYGRGWERK